MSSLSLALSLAAALVAAAPEASAVEGLPAIGYGIGAIVLFLVLLLVTWMFRRTAQTMIEGGHRGADYARTHGGAAQGPHGSGH